MNLKFLYISEIDAIKEEKITNQKILRRRKKKLLCALKKVTHRHKQRGIFVDFILKIKCSLNDILKRKHCCDLRVTTIIMNLCHAKK